MAQKRFAHFGFEPGILSLYYALRDGTMRGIGTAFIVRAMGDRAVALTAAHVSQELNQLAAQRGGTRSTFPNLLQARAFNPDFESDVADIIGERECDGESDQVTIPFVVLPEQDDMDISPLAVLQRPVGRHRLLHSFALKLCPPEPGERVYVAGYSAHAEQESSDSTPENVRMFSSIASVYPARVVPKDEEMGTIYRGAKFELDCDIPSGMSGSPVICFRDSRAYVCGVFSSSGLGRSVCVPIWPALGLHIPVTVGDETLPVRRSLLEVIRLGGIEAYAPEALHFALEPHDDGSNTVHWLER